MVLKLLWLFAVYDLSQKANTGLFFLLTVLFLSALIQARCRYSVWFSGFKENYLSISFLTSSENGLDGWSSPSCGRLNPIHRVCLWFSLHALRLRQEPERMGKLSHTDNSDKSKTNHADAQGWRKDVRTSRASQTRSVSSLLSVNMEFLNMYKGWVGSLNLHNSKGTLFKTTGTVCVYIRTKGSNLQRFSFCRSTSFCH